MKNAIFLLLIPLSLSASSLYGQDLSRTRSADPMQITGSAGMQNLFFSSSNGLGYRSPFSNNFFINLNMSVYGFDIPLAFYYANNNSGFSHPFVQFGMSPRYKDLQLHLGYRSMNFSSFTYSGLSFLGAGLDYHWKIIRVGMFAGTLNQPVSDDPSRSSPRPPLFKRDAIGAKIGVGSVNNYIDFIFFKAKDDTTSVIPVWRSHLTGLENLVVGTNARITIGRFLTLSSEVAGSVFSNDMNAIELIAPELDPLLSYFTPRFSTSLRYAGDLKANLRLGVTNLMASYRYIQPDYYSLGTSFFNHNMKSMGVNMNTTLFKNLLVTGISVHRQEDNVSKRQLYTNRAMMYTANLTARLSQNMNITATYNGFNQNQTDGRAVITDSVRISRLMHNFTLAPSVNIIKSSVVHSYSGNFNLSVNKNQNPMVRDPGNINTLAAGVGYNLALTDQKLNLMANWNLQNSSSDFHTFNSQILGIGASKKLLPEGNLNISINSNLSFSNSNNNIKGVSAMTTGAAGYTINHHHAANFRFNLNNIQNHNREGLYSVSGTDMTLGIGYTYTFTPIRMRSAATSAHP